MKETDWSRHWKENDGNLIGKVRARMMERFYRKLLRGVGLRAPKILELGAGSGISSLLMTKILGVGEVVLVDSNKMAQEISKKTFKDVDADVRFMRKNVLTLDIREKFDIVHSEGLIEHFHGKDRLAVFKKHVDLCRNNGFVAVLVPYESAQYSTFKRIWKMMGKWIWEEEIFTRGELRAMCRRFNLKIVGEVTSPFVHEIGILAKKVY